MATTAASTFSSSFRWHTVKYFSLLKIHSSGSPSKRGISIFLYFQFPLPLSNTRPPSLSSRFPVGLSVFSTSSSTLKSFWWFLVARHKLSHLLLEFLLMILHLRNLPCLGFSETVKSPFQLKYSSLHLFVVFLGCFFTHFLGLLVDGVHLLSHCICYYPANANPSNFPCSEVQGTQIFQAAR